jgi:radical SAM superfamily enzyme YgiQ (UPF0313 family)
MIRVVLVGWFRSIVPEGMDGPFGGQGGFVDTLAPAPYSLANGYLKAVASADPDLRSRYEIELLDLAEPLELEDEREEVKLSDHDLESILATRPDVVGFSAYCWNIAAIAEAAGRLKRANPRLFIVIGGRAGEGDPERLLAAIDGADVLVLGEGELPFRELLRRGLGQLERVPGIVFRAPDGIRRGPPAAAIQRLDDIPSPYLDGILAPRTHGLMLELSRGCAHACGYCTWNAHKRLRWFSPARIEAEIRWAHRQGHRHITLNDSAINYDTARLADNVAAIRRADPAGDIQFTYNIRHDRVTPEQLEALARLPTHMLLLGVETLSPSAMAEVGRSPVELAALRSTMRELARAVRPPVASIVLGLPGDTEHGFLHTLETLLSWTEPEPGGPAAIGCVLVSLLQVYPGSDLWRRRSELGLRFAEHGIPYLLESPTFSADALARCKAALVRRMQQHKDALKAAEAIVLMQAEGGLDPWLRPRRVGALLQPLKVGATVDGWTLERIGLMRDTGEGLLLRFRWRDGGTVRVRIARRRHDWRGRLATRLYSVESRPAESPAPPGPERDKLELLVARLLSEGELRVARGRARQP